MQNVKVINNSWRDIGTPEDTRQVELTYTAKISVVVSADNNLSGYDTNHDMVSFYNEMFDKAVQKYFSMEVTTDQGEAFCDVEVVVNNSNVSDVTGE